MTDGVVVTTKDKLENVIQNDEKSIIIRGKLAEDIQKKRTFRKIGLVSMFVLAASLCIVPCTRLFLYPQTHSAATFQNIDIENDKYVQSPTIDNPARLFKQANPSGSDEDKVSTIDQITEFTKKDIFSINLGLGLLVILSIISLLHKIINKYEEIFFKVEGKVEIRLVHK